MTRTGEKTMAHNQSVLNYLYMAEEVLEKAQSEATKEDYLPFVLQVRTLISNVLENIEDQQDPEYHPDWSVVAITKPRYWQGTQSHQFEQLFEHKGRKFKVLIKRDAYDAQSSAGIYGFDPAQLKWNLIDTIPFEHWPAGAQGITYVRGLTVEQQGCLIIIANELCEIVRKLMFVPE
jgi:hypothetical protein